MRTNEIKNEINDIKKWESKTKRKDLKIETNIYIYIYIYIFDFQLFETIRSFGDGIYNGKINIKVEEKKQTNLLEYIVNFSNKPRPR